MNTSKVFMIFINALFVGTVWSVAVYDVYLGNLLKMQQGLGWPRKLYVAENHQALLKLDTSIDHPDVCSVTTPQGDTFDVSNPSSSRFEKWSEGCGVRIKNVIEEDEGRWRLTAYRGEESVIGWTEVIVVQDTTSYTPTSIALHDGEAKANVVLSTLDSSYCLVAQPFSERSLVPGHCTVTLDKTTRAVQGNWNVLLGIPGRVTELEVHTPVAVQSERMDVGYTHDTTLNKLHLFCNILHSTKNITFCRFQKTNGQVGYNVMDGLSDGTHSYYGEGFLERHCGMTIESPQPTDYGTWRCSVGVQQWVGEHIEPQTPMQALISVAQAYRSNIRQQTDDVEVTTVFVQKDMSFTVMCRADVSLEYCWFQHPNGSQFTPVPLVDDDQPFWYTGESLQTGDCGLTFTHASEMEAGDWTCHMGPRAQLGVEITDRVHVRVTGSLAAIYQEVNTQVGGIATLYCHTSNGNRPLDYCRFLAPNYLGIRVDSTVTKENAILNRFYFTPERSLDYGDCSLTIDPVQSEDIGQWTCAAMINDEVMEARDSITLYVENVATPRPLTQAGIIGMTVGFIVLAALLVGVLAYKKLNVSHLRLPFSAPPRRPPSSQMDIMSMETVSRKSSENSRSSQSSNEITLHG